MIKNYTCFSVVCGKYVNELDEVHTDIIKATISQIVILYEYLEAIGIVRCNRKYLIANFH